MSIDRCKLVKNQGATKIVEEIRQNQKLEESRTCKTKDLQNNEAVESRLGRTKNL